MKRGRKWGERRGNEGREGGETYGVRLRDLYLLLRPLEAHYQHESLLHRKFRREVGGFEGCIARTVVDGSGGGRWEGFKRR